MAKARAVPGLHPRLPFREAVAAMIRVRAQEVFDAREDVMDLEDIERVHRMRVATRRLRAVMELSRPCFEKAAFTPVLRDVKALADALGARRDPDVQLASLVTLAAALPKADLAGLDLLADELRDEQQAGNALLAVALAEVERSDLHGRVLALLDATGNPDEPLLALPGADDDPAEPAAPAELAATPSGELRLEETVR